MGLNLFVEGRPLFVLIGELFGYKKEARSKLMSKKKGVRRIFGK
jgi:hypothetical protein